MAQTYTQVTQQIAALQAKAERLRQREIDGVIERVKVAIDAYGLTPQQLFGASTGALPAARGRPAKSAKRVAKQRYADGSGNVWGGMGPRPQWLRDALTGGKALSDFAQPGAGRSQPQDAVSAPATKAKRKSTKRSAKSAKKRPARQAYSNGKETWSGFGRQPGWLQAALADGRTLDDLKAPPAA